MRAWDYYLGSGMSYRYSTSTTKTSYRYSTSTANGLVYTYNGVPITIHQDTYYPSDPDVLRDALQQWAQESHDQDFMTWFDDGYFVPTTAEPELPPPANDEELEELLS